MTRMYEMFVYLFPAYLKLHFLPTLLRCNVEMCLAYFQAASAGAVSHPSKPIVQAVIFDGFLHKLPTAT